MTTENTIQTRESNGTTFVSLGDYSVLPLERLPRLPLLNNNAWYAEQFADLPADRLPALAHVQTPAGGSEYRPLKRFAADTEWLGRPIYVKRPDCRGNVYSEVSVKDNFFDLEQGPVLQPVKLTSGLNLGDRKPRKVKDKPAVAAAEPTPPPVPKAEEVQVDVSGLASGLLAAAEAEVATAIADTVAAEIEAGEATGEPVGTVLYRKDGRKYVAIQDGESIDGVQLFEKVVNGKGKVKYKPLVAEEPAAESEPAGEPASEPVTEAEPATEPAAEEPVAA
jgi:hypothetical protein